MQTDPGFWRRPSPALFPSLLGFVGLALAWRAAEGLGAPMAVGGALLAAAMLLFLPICLFFAAPRLMAPGRLWRELGTPPGRAAISAGAMGLTLIGGGLAEVAPRLGSWFWFGGLGCHLVILTLVIIRLIRFPAERVMTPLLFLPLVGVIVAPAGGAALGFAALAEALLIYALAVGAVIVVFVLPGVIRGPTPPAARAPIAIFLAPTSVVAIGAAALGHEAVFVAFVYATPPIAALLLLRLKWLLAGGFTPAWGAFTFPSAAFAGAMTLAGARWGGVWEGMAWAALIAASLIVPVILARTLRLWSKGDLAAPPPPMQAASEVK